MEHAPNWLMKSNYDFLFLCFIYLHLFIEPTEFISWYLLCFAVFPSWMRLKHNKAKTCMVVHCFYYLKCIHTLVKHFHLLILLFITHKCGELPESIKSLPVNDCTNIWRHKRRRALLYNRIILVTFDEILNLKVAILA